MILKWQRFLFLLQSHLSLDTNIDLFLKSILNYQRYFSTCIRQLPQNVDYYKYLELIKPFTSNIQGCSA